LLNNVRKVGDLVIYRTYCLLMVREQESYSYKTPAKIVVIFKRERRELRGHFCPDGSWQD
jgi:hypothetical protein